jgi:chloramphenicol 3-O-phosphotransferase
MTPIAIVLHGTTSAGKSSLAKALQDSSDVPVFHISMDAFAEMSRRRDMRSEVELNQALRLHQQNLQLTLRRVRNVSIDLKHQTKNVESLNLSIKHGFSPYWVD